MVVGPEWEGIVLNTCWIRKVALKRVTVHNLLIMEVANAKQVHPSCVRTVRGKQEKMLWCYWKQQQSKP